LADQHLSDFVFVVEILYFRIIYNKKVG